MVEGQGGGGGGGGGAAVYVYYSSHRQSPSQRTLPFCRGAGGRGPGVARRSCWATGRSNLRCSAGPLKTDKRRQS